MKIKTLSTLSLWIFGVIVSAILTAGLVFYQNNQNNNQANQNNNQSNQINGNKIVRKIAITPLGTILDMSEITKHKTQNNCWFLIGGKVYDITSFFGSHPGGNGNMAATCGTDATAAYNTKNPNARTGASGGGHSGNAKSILASYFIGDLNQSFTNSAIQAASTVAPVVNTKRDEWEDD